MPKNLPSQDSSQQRASKLLLAMGVIVLLGALAYFVLTLVVNRRTPATPDTHYTADNGIVLNYESAVWPVCWWQNLTAREILCWHQAAEAIIILIAALRLCMPKVRGLLEPCSTTCSAKWTSRALAA